MAQPIDIVSAPTSAFEGTKHHARLAVLAGTWKGTTATWLDPSSKDPSEEAAVDVRVESVLGGRFLRIQYASTAMGKPHAGEMLVAFEKDDDRWAVAWIDSFHTGSMLMHSTSNRTPNAEEPISVLGSYPAGPDQRWGWRTVIHPHPERFVIEAFNVKPDGTEEPALKTQLTRV
jgi:hypothetical protein